MKKQGTERSHHAPKQYQWKILKWILDSPTGVIWIDELEVNKLMVGLQHTTLSGT